MRMRQSTLLIVNTLATYARMAITVGMGLVATRLLVRQLGLEDFGLLAALGASGAMFLLVTEGLTTSVQRQLAYEIGRGDRDRLEVVFHTAWLTYLGVGLAFVVGLAALGPVVLRILDIPAGRETAAGWVYYLVVINLGLLIMAAPYRAVAEAHQAVVLTALFGVMDSLVLLGAALCLLMGGGGDRLIRYAVWLLGLRVVSVAAAAGITMGVFKESRPRRGRFEWEELKRTLALAGWTILGSAAWRLRTQGSQVVLNVAFGPLANSANSVAEQLAGYQNSLGGSIYNVARAAAVSLYAKEAKEQVRELVILTCKYSTAVMLFLTVPMLVDTENLLRLWLKDVPPMAVEFTVLTVLWQFLLRLSGGYYLAILAHGQLGRYMVGMAGADLAVPAGAAVAFFVGGAGPVALPMVALGMSAVQVGIQVGYGGAVVGLPVRQWLRQVCLRNLVAGGLGAAGALVPRLIMGPGWLRLGSVAVVCAVVLIPAIWWVVLQPWERQRYGGLIREGLKGEWLKRRETPAWRGQESILP